MIPLEKFSIHRLPLLLCRTPSPRTESAPCVLPSAFLPRCRSDDTVPALHSRLAEGGFHPPCPSPINPLSHGLVTATIHTISPNSTTFSPRMRNRPRGNSAKAFPWYIRSTVSSRTKFAAQDTTGLVNRNRHMKEKRRTKLVIGPQDALQFTPVSEYDEHLPYKQHGREKSERNVIFEQCKPWRCATYCPRSPPARRTL